MTMLAIIVLILALFLAQSVEGWKECKKKSFGLDSFVCVCSAQYCDSAPSVANSGLDQDQDKMVYFVSDRTEHRMAKFELNSPSTDAQSMSAVEVRIGDAAARRQRIFGFGGAFTDAAGITMNSLSEGARRTLLEAYFDSQIGIGYSLGRVPIASTDFSVREYSYLDTPNDFDLSTFGLAKEDMEDKIPHILAARRMTNETLQLFASPWSPPGWMKTTGQMKGSGLMKGPFNGRYYRTYAHYFRRFFEAYAERNVTFWGVTIENEPGAGLLPHWDWQALGLSAKMQRDFAVGLLSPVLKSSVASKHLKLMAHDDQRSYVLPAAKQIYETLEGAEAIDGLGVHWYSHSTFDVLSQTHNLRPDKFILATEACTGYAAGEHRPLLGDWSRANAYAHDILNDLRNWAIGWTDWNLCLNRQGGPNWVGNYVDAPIIVNASADEFYKQPMFYAMAHFSRFLPRDSVILSSSLWSNGIELMDNPLEGPEKMPHLDMNRTLTGNPVEHLAAQRPDGLRVLVLLNSDRIRSLNISITDLSHPDQSWAIPVGPSSIVTALWRPKSAENAKNKSPKKYDGKSKKAKEWI